MIISVSDRKENIEEKRENAGFHYFHLFLQCFQKPSFLGPRKAGIVWERVEILTFYHTNIEKIFGKDASASSQTKSS